MPVLISETREIAEEGLKLLQSKMGTTAYLEEYNSVRQDVLGKRRERKMKRSIEVVTDPERAAKKKIRQHDKVYFMSGSQLILSQRIKGSEKWRNSERNGWFLDDRRVGKVGLSEAKFGSASIPRDRCPALEYVAVA
jgi:hypothetical protein